MVGPALLVYLGGDEELHVAELPQIGAKVNPIELPGPKTYHIEGWSGMRDEKRLNIIRQVALRRGRDPRIATLVLQIIREAGCQPREYVKQAAALLRWVQDPKNCYYVNEPGERLQDPLYTLRVKYGDCDDMALLLCAMFESIKLEWKLVISGRQRISNKKVRHIEGGYMPQQVQWAHIYCMVGDRPFTPQKWFFCEPTLNKAPLGWDVVAGSTSALPEMGGAGLGSTGLGDGMASGAGSAVASSLEESATSGRPVSWKNIGIAVLTGVATSVTAQIILEQWREKRAEQRRLEQSKV